MKKWDDLDVLERFKLLNSCEKSFYPTEGTIVRLDYVKTIYNLLYELDEEAALAATRPLFG